MARVLSRAPARTCGVLALWLAPCLALAQRPPDRDEALELIRRGEIEAAVALLRAPGASGAENALLLGNALLSQRRPAEAIAPLERAAAAGLIPGYVHLLLARAILEAEASARFPEAERLMAQWAGNADASPVIRERASHLLVKLQTEQKSWPAAARSAEAYLSQANRGRRADEVRWLHAEALREAGRLPDALRAYEAVWYDATGSPNAKQAGARIEELVAAGAGQRRTLRAEERRDFAASLQRVGLHEEALAELDRYQRQPGAKPDAALVLRAGSLYVLRRNAEVVRAAERLRTRYPSSPHVPAAVLHAIGALRRTGDEAAIRSWVRFLEEKYGDTPKTFEALYALGVFLASVHKDADAEAQLLRVARATNQNQDDALWKLVWLDRGRNKTDDAVARLKQLLKDLPGSPYRKAALYWLARFTFATDRELAVAQLQRLLEEFPHDYYGHQALNLLNFLKVPPDRIGNGARFPDFDRLQDPNARRHEAYQRAVELRRAGLDELASDELARVPGAASDPALQFPLAELRAQAGETMEAMAILERAFPGFRQAGSRDPALVPREFWYVYYPFRYRSAVERAVRETGLEKSGVPPELLAALIRTESRFLPTAVSPAGAVGLMQLMPRVAARLAEARGQTVSREQLFDPAVNIKYGAFYFASLVRTFGGQREPAIASYNGGADMAKAWWAARASGAALDELIESIPYVESRLYVKTILGDAENYAWIYGKTP